MGTVRRCSEGCEEILFRVGGGLHKGHAGVGE